jgi:UDP-glucose 4-epimerase
MKIALTGASGFLGKEVFASINKSYPEKDIIKLVNSRGGLTGVKENLPNTLWKPSDSQSLNSVKVVIHMGSYTPKSNSATDQFTSSFSTIQATDQLMKLPFPKLKKFIYLSSMDVYADRDEIVSTRSQTRATNGYSAMKLYCEGLLQDYFKDSGTDLVILRLGHLFGPGDEIYKKFIPTLIRASLLDEFFETDVGSLDALNLLFVRDAADMIAALIDSSYTPSIAHLISNKPIFIADVISEIERISGKLVKVRHSPKSIKTKKYNFDISKLQTELLVDETRFSEALLETYMYQKGLYEQHNS